MFDGLLGRRFSVKCKQAIKCINERLKVIRKRKQAMLSFLKQDIAVLLRDGHDSHAFNRMDALIVEINLLACYDMIEKFCECILKQLPSLQKQRECPLEDREAVSTLIFAAARFSDLPELCDLRHVFMARYGGAMETSLNLEFQEKLVSKSFVTATKVQLMENIAEDFFVDWDSGSLKWRITDPTANECVNEEVGKKSDGMYDPSTDTVKDVVTETKDIHVIDHESEPTRKSKLCDDELENVSPHPPDTLISYYAQPKKNKDGTFVEDRQKKDDTYRSPRAREVLDPIDQEGKVFEEMKSKDDYRAKSKVPPLSNREPDGVDAEDWHDDQFIYNRSPWARGKLENGTDADDWNGNDTHFMRSSKARMHRESEQRQRVAGYEFEDNDKSIKVQHPKRKGIKDATDSDDNMKQAAREHVFEDNEEPIKIPPYVKSKVVKDAIHSDDWDKDGTVNWRCVKAGKDADLAAQEGQLAGPWKSNHNRALHMIPPPYVKPKVSALTDHAKSSSLSTSEDGLAASDKSSSSGFGDPKKGELVVERPKPRSVRRINKKSPVVEESDNAVDSAEPVPRIQHDQRMHAARENTVAPQDEYDSEEEAINRLLIHYSKKKTPPYQSRKHRERTQAHAEDHVIDGCEVGQNQTCERCYIRRPEPPHALCADCSVDSGKAEQCQTHLRHHTRKPESVHPPGRAVSLPTDPVNTEEKARVPARAASMQPDVLSPPGGRTHPKLPDYEEFAAKFAALRRG